jgi:hypothetical protein
MDKPDQNIINKLAQELDCGNDCFYNPETKELICIPSADLRAMGDEEYYEEVFKDDFEKIKRQKQDLIKIEVLESFESFKIMENFKNELIDEQFKKKINEALTNRKPFQNFKYLIDTSEYRESWFEFKHQELEKIVVKIIERNSPNT